MKQLLIIFIALLPSISRAATPVSLIKLIVNPAEFVDKEIVVSGFMPGTPTYLFLTKEHAKMRDGDSAIPLNLGNYSFDDGCVLGYIKVTGELQRFDFSYWLSNIEHVYSVEQGRYCNQIKPGSSQERSN